MAPTYQKSESAVLMLTEKCVDVTHMVGRREWQECLCSHCVHLVRL